MTDVYQACRTCIIFARGYLIILTDAWFCS